jgi:hypothetical protein
VNSVITGCPHLGGRIAQHQVRLSTTSRARSLPPLPHGRDLRRSFVVAVLGDPAQGGRCLGRQGPFGGGETQACSLPSEELRADLVTVLAVVQRNGTALADASEELLADHEIVLAAAQHRDTYWWMPPRSSAPIMRSCWLPCSSMVMH